MFVLVRPGPPAAEHRAETVLSDVGGRGRLDLPLRHLADLLVQREAVQDLLRPGVGLFHQTSSHRGHVPHGGPEGQQPVGCVVFSRRPGRGNRERYPEREGTRPILFLPSRIAASIHSGIQV